MNTIRDPITGASWQAPRDLIDYVSSTHHAFLCGNLWYVNCLLDRMARERLEPATLVDPLRREFTALEDLLESHLDEQEGKLFGQICRIREPVAETGWSMRLADDLAEALDQMARKNTQALAMADCVLARLRNSNWRYNGGLVSEMTENILELRTDLAEHFHLETDLLFPHVREMLRKCGLAAPSGIASLRA